MFRMMPIASRVARSNHNSCLARNQREIFTALPPLLCARDVPHALSQLPLRGACRVANDHEPNARGVPQIRGRQPHNVLPLRDGVCWHVRDVPLPCGDAPPLALTS